MSIILFHWIAFYVFRELICCVFDTVNDASLLYKVELFTIGLILPITLDIIYESFNRIFVKNKK